MKQSAGILISYNHEEISGFLFVRKYLFAHPTNHSWYGTFGIPKGRVNREDGSLLETALRETKEEVGLQLSYKDIENPNDPIIIDYKNGHKVYKKVYVYKAHLTDLAPYIHIFDEETLQVKPEFLQQEEVDWASFMSVLALEDKIFHRFIPLIAEELAEASKIFNNIYIYKVNRHNVLRVK